MPKKSKKATANTSPKIKSYIAPQQPSTETLVKLNTLVESHPSQREYLSTREFNKTFAADKKEVDQFLAYAKEKSWDVDYDKKTRELQISILNASEFVKENTETQTGSDA